MSQLWEEQEMNGICSFAKTPPNHGIPLTSTDDDVLSKISPAHGPREMAHKLISVVNIACARRGLDLHSTTLHFHVNPETLAQKLKCSLIEA
jgi:hypothetical protein